MKFDDCALLRLALWGVVSEVGFTMHFTEYREFSVQCEDVCTLRSLLMHISNSSLSFH